MAETIFGTTPFSAGMEAYSAGIGAQQARPRADAQTSLLSTQAEQARMQLAAEKQAQAISLAAKAAKAEAMSKNLDIDASNTEGQIKLIDVAIKASSNNPELVDSLNSQKTQLLSEQAGIATSRMKIREEKANQLYDGIRGAFLDPTSTVDGLNQLASGVSDPQDKARLNGLVRIMSPGSTIPVPGYGKPYSRFTPQEQQTFKADIIRAYAPPKVEKTAADIMAEQYRLSNLEEKRLNDQLKDLRKAQEIAAKQSNTGRKEQITRDREIAKLDADFATKLSSLQKAYDKIPEEIDNPDKSGINWLNPDIPSTIPNPSKQASKALIEQLRADHEEDKARMQERDPLKPKRGTKENPIKLD